MGMGLLTTFDRGLPTGPTWMATYRGGYLYGELDSRGRFTGDSMAHVFPDLVHAYVGKYEDKVMAGVKRAKVMGQR